MKPRHELVVAAFLSVLYACAVHAQELPPNLKKLKDGIYVYVGTNASRIISRPRTAG